MSLPGSLLKVPAGSMCEEHEDRPALYNVQGETDSLGYESCLMCEECYQACKAEPPMTGRCAWCPAVEELVPVRDPDEGSSGPVYWVCRSCRDKHNERINKELQEEMDHRYDLNPLGDIFDDPIEDDDLTDEERENLSDPDHVQGLINRYKGIF